MSKRRLEIKLNLLGISKKRLVIVREKARYRLDHQCEFFNPLSHQQKVLEFLHNGKKTIVLQGANQIGKTITGVLVCSTVALGYEPWSGTASIFGKPPTKTRIICSDWEHHAKEVIVPKLKEWLPRNRYITKKNNVGVEAYFIFDNGSTIELLTHVQDTKSHESWTGHFVWADEPIPKDKYSANKRGLVFNDGVFLLTMTAVYEPWIKRELVDIHNKNTGLVLNVDIHENTYLTNEAIEEFENACSKEEKEARIKGGWLQLSGRVIPEFDNTIHVVDSFVDRIPSDWPVVAMVDTHLKLPHAISFIAIDKYNRMYVVEECWDSMKPEDIADEILRFKTKHSVRLENAFFDPLSKGDTEYIKRLGMDVPDTFSIVADKLRPAGIACYIASKDKKSGIANIRGAFCKDYKVSTMFICDNCLLTIEELNNWVYDKDTNKPKDEDDHFVENLYRATLSGVKYTDPRTYSDYEPEPCGVV